MTEKDPLGDPASRGPPGTPGDLRDAVRPPLIPWARPGHTQVISWDPPGDPVELQRILWTVLSCILRGWRLFWSPSGTPWWSRVPSGTRVDHYRLPRCPEPRMHVIYTYIYTYIQLSRDSAGTCDLPGTHGDRPGTLRDALRPPRDPPGIPWGRPGPPLARHLASDVSADLRN